MTNIVKDYCAVTSDNPRVRQLAKRLTPSYYILSTMLLVSLLTLVSLLVLAPWHSTTFGVHLLFAFLFSAIVGMGITGFYSALTTSRLQDYELNRVFYWVPRHFVEVAHGAAYLAFDTQLSNRQLLGLMQAVSPETFQTWMSTLAAEDDVELSLMLLDWFNEQK